MLIDWPAVTAALAQALAPYASLLVSWGANGPERVPDANWDVTTRPDGINVRLEFASGATDPQKAAARAAVLAADLTPSGQASARTQQLRSDALALLQSASALLVGLRAVLTAAIGAENAGRQRLALLEAAITGASTLADCKSRVAALPPIVLVNPVQAARDRINAGDAD